MDSFLASGRCEPSCNPRNRTGTHTVCSVSLIGLYEQGMELGTMVGEACCPGEQCRSYKTRSISRLVSRDHLPLGMELCITMAANWYIASGGTKFVFFTTLVQRLLSDCLLVQGCPPLYSPRSRPLSLSIQFACRNALSNLPTYVLLHEALPWTNCGKGKRMHWFGSWGERRGSGKGRADL